MAAREGGSYIKEKDGSLKLVQNTKPAPAEQKPTAVVDTAKTDEVITNEDA